MKTAGPVGLAQFRYDAHAIGTYAARDHANIISQNFYDRGGHFAAHQEPDLLVGDIRGFFTSVRYRNAAATAQPDPANHDNEEPGMKYLVMIYSNPQSWGHPAFARTAEFLAGSQAERDEMSAQFGALMQEMVESGELIGGQALADPVNTRTVRVRDGVS